MGKIERVDTTEAGIARPRCTAPLGVAAGLRPEPPITAAPIWLAALISSGCRANGGGPEHAVRWSCVSGRALYTNGGASTEQIEPLGVSVPAGGTLVVYWAPGRAEYTLEISSRGGRFGRRNGCGGNRHRAGERGSAYAK